MTTNVVLQWLTYRKSNKQSMKPRIYNINEAVIVWHRLVSVAVASLETLPSPVLFQSLLFLFSSSTLLPLHFVTLSTQCSLGWHLPRLVPIGRPLITAQGRPPCLITWVHHTAFRFTTSSPIRHQRPGQILCVIFVISRTNVYHVQTPWPTPT